MSKQVTLMTDAIPYQEFAKLIGKSTGAVRRMIDKAGSLATRFTGMTGAG